MWVAQIKVDCKSNSCPTTTGTESVDPEKQKFNRDKIHRSLLPVAPGGLCVLYTASCIALRNLQTWMSLTNPGLISCHDLRGKVLLTTHRDSVLLHFYLAPDMYPPPLATRNKTRHVSRLRRASCTMRGEMKMKEPFLCKQNLMLRQMRTAPVMQRPRPRFFFLLFF